MYCRNSPQGPMILCDIVGAVQYGDVLGISSCMSPCYSLQTSVSFENTSIYVLYNWCILCFQLSQHSVVVSQSSHEVTIQLDYFIAFSTYFNGLFSYLTTKKRSSCPWRQQQWCHCKKICWQQKPWEQKEHWILPPQAPRRPCNIKRWLASKSMVCFFTVIDSDSKTILCCQVLSIRRGLEPIPAFHFIIGPPGDKQLITFTVTLMAFLPNVLVARTSNKIKLPIFVVYGDTQGETVHFICPHCRFCFSHWESNYVKLTLLPLGLGCCSLISSTG